MAKKYKYKITKAYLISIEDENGYEVESDWSFLDYTETKKIAEKMLEDTTRVMSKVSPLDMSALEGVSVGRDCHLCGSMFPTGMNSEETICPKCKELWKEFVESREAE